VISVSREKVTARFCGACSGVETVVVVVGIVVDVEVVVVDSIVVVVVGAIVVVVETIVVVVCRPVVKTTARTRQWYRISSRV
jgi:hypothetical protein